MLKEIWPVRNIGYENIKNNFKIMNDNQIGGIFALIMLLGTILLFILYWGEEPYYSSDEAEIPFSERYIKKFW